MRLACFFSCLFLGLSLPHRTLGEPLIEFLLEEGAENSGYAGGEAERVVYAPGEDLLFLPGPWGDCLDLTSASRFGGVLEERDPAGSALIFRSPALGNATDLTVCCWMQGASKPPDVSSRILTQLGGWELNYSRGCPTFTVVGEGVKTGYRCSSPAVDSSREWMFVSCSVDAKKQRLTLRTGGHFTGLEKPITVELASLPSPNPGELQIGNFQGIRPFKGRLDLLRIYDACLSDAQVQKLFQEDVDAYLRISPKNLPSPRCSLNRSHFMKPGDIPFRVLSQGRLTSLQGFEVMEKYHATHLLWVYGNDPEAVKRTKEMGLWYQASQNGLCGFMEATPDRSKVDDQTGRQRDFDGNGVVLPHMSKWNPEHPRWTGCHNSPAFRKLFFDEARRFLEIGVDSLHVDDWMMSYTTTRNGLGCFCPSCMEGFREFLRGTLSSGELKALGVENIDAFDYRTHLKEKERILSQDDYKRQFRDLPLTPLFMEYQREGLREFYADYREVLRRASPQKTIPISVNNQFSRRGENGSFRGLAMVDLIDFFSGEAFRTMQTAAHYIMPCKMAYAAKIPQVMMCKPKNVATSQAALATCYALGCPMRVPWDLYMDIDEEGRAAPRYFGEEKDWLPFYDFINEHSELFNGYETVVQVGALICLNDEPYDTVWETCERLSRLQVPFQIMLGEGGEGKGRLMAEDFASIRYVLQCSPTDLFSPHDRQIIEEIKASGRTRFLSPQDDIVQHLSLSHRYLVQLEGPDNVYAFLCASSDAEDQSWVIHLVNWNTRTDGSPDPYSNVTLSLSQVLLSEKAVRCLLYAPGASAPNLLPQEEHPARVRITIPQIQTWALVHVGPSPVRE